MTIAQQIPMKEKTRGPKLALMARSSFPMMEAIMDADKAGLVIASSKRLTQALGSAESKPFNKFLPCWSGTMIGYDRFGKPLDDAIVYTDPTTQIKYVFPVPADYRGMKDIALVAEHPDFIIQKDGNARIVRAKKIGIVGLPRLTHQPFHLGDPVYDIPHGDSVDKRNQNARQMMRDDKHVGLITRSTIANQVLLNAIPSARMGVIVEAADGKELSSQRSS